MKVSEFIVTHKVAIGFAAIAIIATLIAIGLFFNILPAKSYYLKFYGGVLTGAAAILLALILFVFDESGAIKSDAILGNTSETIEKLESLRSENISLRKEVVTLQNDQIKKNKEILELSAKIFQQDKESHDLATGGSSYPDLTHSQITLFEKGVQASGDKLHLSFDIYNTGEYPLDNLKIRGYQVKDFRSVAPVFLWTELSLSGLNIRSRFSNTNKNFNESFNRQNLPVISSDYDVFKANQRVSIGIIPFKEEFEYYGINLFIESKRQDWIILLRLYRPINSKEQITYQAHKIMKVTSSGLENIDEKIELGFSKGANNKFIWFNSELPNEWFTKK
jgi:hypothetical protein